MTDFKKAILCGIVFLITVFFIWLYKKYKEWMKDD